jgi:hypothetical protein
MQWKFSAWGILIAVFALLFSALPGALYAEQNQEAVTKRAFLCCDLEKNRIFMVNSEGIITWEFEDRRVHDFWLLENGNILYARPSIINEVNWEKEITSRYKAPAGYRLYTCQPLPNGNILTAINGSDTRILEIDSEGHVVLEIITAKAGRIRLCRKTSEGTYLLAARSEHAIWEYAADGELLREIKAPGNVYLGVRLENGNTMIACGDGHAVVEVDPRDNVVWKLEENDLPGIPMRFGADFQLLPNGNLLFCNWGGHGHVGGQAQLVEVTRDKEITWALEDWQRFGTPCHVQVLEDGGSGNTFGSPLRPANR